LADHCWAILALGQHLEEAEVAPAAAKVMKAAHILLQALFQDTLLAQLYLPAEAVGWWWLKSRPQDLAEKMEMLA
jgi:hypothetical protein